MKTGVIKAINLQYKALYRDSKRDKLSSPFGTRVGYLRCHEKKKGRQTRQILSFHLNSVLLQMEQSDCNSASFHAFRAGRIWQTKRNRSRYEKKWEKTDEMGFRLFLERKP